MSCVISKYWNNTYGPSCEEYGLTIRIYLVGIIATICVNLFLLVVIVNRSAQGGITDTQSRWLVAPILTFKIILILPETILNIFGTVWAFCDSIHCETKDFYSKTVIECKFFESCLIVHRNRFSLHSHCRSKLDRICTNRVWIRNCLQSSWIF